MDWQVFSGICAALFAVLQIASTAITVKIKGAISELKIEIAQQRAEDQQKRSDDKEELKDWADERFVLRREI